MSENLVVGGTVYNAVDYVTFRNTSGSEVNYYQGLTEEDKAEIAQMVIESFGGNPIVGYVDENNNIIVQGNLADGSYSVKYEMADGSEVDIGNLVLDSGVAEPTYTNQIPISTNASGGLFVGANGEQGYKTDTRVSLSSGNESAQSGYEITGFIPVKLGDTIRIKNIDVANDNYTNIAFYDSSKVATKGSATTVGAQLYTFFVQNGTYANGVYSVKLTETLHGSLTSAVAYCRISSNSITDDSIVTVNQEIV